MKKSTLIVATAVIATITTGSARAGLITSFDFNLTTTKAATTLTHAGTHTYGTSQTGILPSESFPSRTLSIDSTIPQATAINNLIGLDLSAIVGHFTGGLDNSVSTLHLSNLQDGVGGPVSMQPGTIRLFSDATLLNEFSTLFIIEAPGNTFTAAWNNSNLDPGTQTLYMTWNSVPTPGPLALLSVAGILARGRRRRG